MIEEPSSPVDDDLESNDSSDVVEVSEDATLSTSPPPQKPADSPHKSPNSLMPSSPTKISRAFIVSDVAMDDDSGDKKETSIEDTTVVQTTQKSVVSTVRPVAAVAPPSNGVVTQRKVIGSTSGSPNILHVTPVWPANKAAKTPQAVVWTAVKGGKIKRVLIPSSQAVSTGVPATSKAATLVSSGSVVLQHGNKPVQKTYVVKSKVQSPKVGSVSVVPSQRPTTVYIDGQGNPIQTKLITNNMKLNNGRIFTNSTPVRPVGVLPSCKVITSSGVPSGCNVVGMAGTPRFTIAGKMSTVLTSGDKRIVIAKASQALRMAHDQNQKMIEIRQPKSLENSSTEIPSPSSATVTFNTSSSSSHPINGFQSSEEELSGQVDRTVGSEDISESCQGENLVDPEDFDSHSKDGPANPEEGMAPERAAEVAEPSIYQFSPRTSENLDDGPPEKESALRKAKILSFPKSKASNSILNGMLDRKSEPPSATRQAESGIIYERVRKRKDNHRSVGANETPQKLLRTQESIISIKALPYADTKSPLDVIKWDGMGMGLLPGSTLRFVRNDEGMLEVHEPLLAPKIEFYKDAGEMKVKKRDASEIYCCVICGCYGLLSEFYNEHFCSTVCNEKMNEKFNAISRKLIEEPLVLEEAPAVEAPSRKRSKTMASAKIVVPGTDDEPPVKKKRKDDINSEDYTEFDKKSDDSFETSKSTASVTQGKQETSKPIIKVKSMDILAVSGRQLRTRDSIGSTIMKPPSKYISNQDLEGINSDDDENLKNENMDPFPWPEYLERTRSKAAWVKLFKNPFPSGSNPFKIGFKLEAIDPERQKFVCAATIADIQGYRIKVHFDGYSNKYDFWVNIDSPSIFFCGYSLQHGIDVQPPCGVKKSAFNWDSYNSSRKSRPAPLSWFQCQQSKSTSTNMFRAGMKLEAVDRKNTQLTCVATVVFVLENRILVHFDSWSDVYDYWVDTSSPYIHPVGWCASRNRELTPPNYLNPETFSWARYLKETNSEPAPSAAFTLRPPIDFRRNTKLEVIDKRAPHLLRVATIKEVLPYQIKIAFDGFPDHFGYWVDDDSPDIHPVSWGHKTGHPLTAPPDEFDLKGGRSKCPTPGCVGDGNYLGLHTGYHSTLEECPYSMSHLSAESPLQDRLSSKGHKKKLLGQDDGDSDGDDPNSQWKFLDMAVVRSGPKSRLSSEGKVVFPEKETALPELPPSKPGIKSIADCMPFTDDIRNDEKFENEGKGRRKSSDRPDKLKRPLVGRNGKVQEICEPKIVRTDRDDVRDVSKIQSSPLLGGADARDVLGWSRQQCIEKIRQRLPTKVRSVLRKLELDGGRLMMLNSVMDRLLVDLTPLEAKTLFSFLTTLYSEAITDLSKWKKSSHSLP